jgi:NTP pyrophosphatase (non-canonical NTP hydrolase)|tara:strand:+ start:137 stop:472 length:336 start_codon:yes stop_codon:yes gene_type:complete
VIKNNWNLNNYQMKARKFSIYPERMKIMYPALGLAGEAGEVADKVKKIYRDGRDDARFKGDIAREIGDVLWYCSALADDLGFSLQQIAEMNIYKLSCRMNKGTIVGDGDDR